MENQFETINQQLAEITKQIGSIAAELAARGSVDGTKSNLPKNDYIGLTEAAAITGYSAFTLRRYVYDKSVPFYRIGSKICFREQELRDWMEARTRHSVAEDGSGIIAEAPACGSADSTKSNLPKCDYIDVKEAAAITGYTERTLRNYVYNKRVPFYRIDGKVCFRAQELRDWMDARTHRSVPARWEAKQQTTPMGNGN